MEFQVKVLLLTFALTVVLSVIIVPILRRLKVGQIERNDGPQSHLKKQGTPTMGGIIIILSMCIVCVILTLNVSSDWSTKMSALDSVSL